MRISDWSSDVCSSDLIAVGTLAVAGTSLALNLSPNPFAAMEIMTWLLGSLENRSFDHVWIALPCIAAGAMMLLWNGRALDALTLGEAAAQALGTDLRRARVRLVVGNALGGRGGGRGSGGSGFVRRVVCTPIRPPH